MKIFCKEAITPKDQQIAKNLKDIELFFLFDKEAYLKIYSKKKIPITDIILLLHDFGITTLEDVSYEVDSHTYINLFKIAGDIEKLQRTRENVENILKLALLGKILQRCKLYRLAIEENLSLSHIIFLRAMIKYLDQLLIEKREASIIKILLRYPDLSSLFAQYFFANESTKEELRNHIQNAFKKVVSFEEDKVLKIFYQAIIHIEKTNFFEGKETKSFKFAIASFKQMVPDLQPNIEMFVYHPDFQGTHMRVSRVSRGGIRWSDREDFREEIKSLMITQEAKNAIIVPSGAKGGFYIHKKVNKEEFRHYYSLYIDALLDLIDKDPTQGEDFYFVVAADKGTSHMSDVANEIAIKKGYWLKDAFASGGSHGFNHKKLGVTAKGAWISAQRHFIQRGIDIFKDPITIIGTGSMRGDVFGNGLLINPQAKLLGAISSHEIFIDPDPDPKIAYEERKRLFEKEKGWREYDPNKISEGGGVFLREAKDISLSPQIKRLLGIKRESISGEELAKELLKLEVDMLYIGGIGTYIKSSEELNLYIADKYNENVRIDASEVRAYAICEGGNLGLTQKARIEYAKMGGHINLDHIDNSAGVDTSDHEVNIKIVLNRAIEEGKLDEERKFDILNQLTQDVLHKVFQTNFLQPLAITLDEIRSKNTLEDFIKTIDILEKDVEYFKRKDYAIPKNKELHTVCSPQGGLVRPVLGILLSFAKIFLKNEILRSDILEHPFFEHYLYKYFPKSLYPLFEAQVLSHPLKKEIMATVAANIIINNAGASFIADYEELGEEKFLLKIKVYLLLYTLLSITKVKRELYEQQNGSEKIYEMLLDIEHSVDFSIKWVIRNYNQINCDPFHILNYKEEIAKFLGFKDGFSKNFFQYIDLVKFIMLAIYISEIKEYKLDDILQLLLHIINRFKIDTLLVYLNKIEPKSDMERELKNQLIELLEYFVTVTAKDIIIFTRNQESLESGFQSYLQEKMIDPQKYVKKIEKLESIPNKMLFLTNIIHQMLLEAI